MDDERREDVDDDDVDVGRGWDSWGTFDVDVDVLPLIVSVEDGVLLIEVVGFDFEDFIFDEARKREVYWSIQIEINLLHFDLSISDCLGCSLNAFINKPNCLAYSL